MSRTVIFLLNLSTIFLGILIIWFNYLRTVTPNPDIGFFAKRGLILGVVIGALNIFIQLINHLKPQPAPPATRQDVEQLFAEYMGEKPKNPPVEEVKSEIEKELKVAFEKQEKKALELYELGDSAYDNNQFQEAITHFKAALEVVKTPSIYLSLGNSLLVTSDFRAALTTYQAALELFKNSKDKKGEGNALGGIGLAYYSLGQYDKAIEYYERALAIAREIGDRQGEGSDLGNLGNAYYSLGQYDKARDLYRQAIKILDEIKSPNAEICRKNLALLEAEGK
jgi:tetratricopeptide (TPR) repeat protein